jgi:PPK2 family polyphosphate:nucleotide phosphotransferase
MALDLAQRLRVKPGSRLHLDRVDPAATPGVRDRAQAERRLEANVKRLFALQYKLYAENRRSLLIVLQAMDAAGKDGTIRHVMSGLNPQGCSVKAFKAPAGDELEHDYLWRVHQALPARGDIGIFNRSHYEEVLVVRVRELVPRSVWSKRYEQINAFEETIAETGTVILKFFLHISKDEQKRRFQERLDDPRKRWKFAPSDLETRERWDDYMEAYQDALSRCSTKHAPWFVIPADRKWYRNLAVAEIIVETLEGLDMKFPKPTFDPKTIHIE